MRGVNYFFCNKLFFLCLLLLKIKKDSPGTMILREKYLLAGPGGFNLILDAAAADCQRGVTEKGPAFQQGEYPGTLM